MADPDDVRDAVLRAAEDVFQLHADRLAAEGWSTPDDVTTANFGEDVIVVAEFGDAVAVNGDLADSAPRIPPGYLLTNDGGSVPSTEMEIDVAAAAVGVAKEAGRRLGVNVGAPIVEAILAEEYGDLAYLSSSGGTEVYARRPSERRRRERPRSSAKEWSPRKGRR